jgi:hypothetical protein
MSKEKRNINFPRKIALWSRVVLPPETKGPLLSLVVTPPGTKERKIAFRASRAKCPFCHGW